MDSLVKDGLCQPPDVMKIDVEGHEYEVLRGAYKTIASRCPQIFVEPHGGEGGVANRDRIRDFLSPFGYRFQNIGYAVRCYKET
ncbi:MAG: FkbM family methyltransferase [Chloroflexota bacterium]